ncbi:MAG: enoyl-CoA hydratase/isomerase family protein [Proteobacteria bacterium]|nr:enoyl-CoA hydratase/isomerase family protein [Pseudomonadota bacterium]
MSFTTIKTHRAGPAQIITIDRPERRNALSIACIEEIMSAARAAEADATVRGVILTGGGGYFSAGADLSEAIAIEGPADGHAYFRRFHRAAEVLEALGKPVIAAIEGFCMTGGLELALACDLRVGAEGSSYAITSARIGTMAGAGGTQRLPRLLGPSRALDLLFAAEPIDAAEAHRIGLIDRLVPKGSAIAEAQRMIELYATRAPLSLAFVKRAVHQGLEMGLAAGLELEANMVSEIYTTADKQEGIRAFLEKRRPTFTGC